MLAHVIVSQITALMLLMKELRFREVNQLLDITQVVSDTPVTITPRIYILNLLILSHICKENF